MLSAEEFTSTLSEALFHYREVLTIRESERGDDLPQKGKLPATEDDDIIQHEYDVQLEAINRLLERVDDMVDALVKPSEKSAVGLRPDAPTKPQLWAEPYAYQKDESFINPFTGKLVEVPSSLSYGPGPSAREGPLKDIPPSFWDDYNYSPSPKRSNRAGKKTYLPNLGNEEDHADYTQRDNLYSGQGSSSGAEMTREISLPGAWASSWSNSWTIPPDEHPNNFPTKPAPPTTSTLSRTTSKILRATNPWGRGWMSRANYIATTQLEEIQEKSQKGSEPAKPTASSILELVSNLYSGEGTKDNKRSTSSAKESAGPTNEGQYGSKDKGKRKRWRTAPEQQKVDEEVKEVPYPSLATDSSNNPEPPELKEPLKSTESVIPVPTSPPIIPINSENPSTSSINSTTSATSTNPTNSTSASPSSSTETLSSEVSSAIESDLWHIPEDEEKLLDLNGYFDSSSDEGVPVDPPQESGSKNTTKAISDPRPASDTFERLQEDQKSTEGLKHDYPVDENVPTEVIEPLPETRSNQQESEPPKYPPELQHPDQVERDGALAERLAVFEADFQKPSDLFEDEDGAQESKDLLSQLEQYQRDRELAEQLAMGYDQGYDPETLALIAELADGAPQDYDALLEQEVANELLIAELSGGVCQDFDTMLKIRRQDRELAIKLAEDSPQDLKEHMRYLQEQEEFARKAQESWDEDIRKSDQEEAEKLAEMARQEEMEEQERLRKERMATCTVCSEEGLKENMAMLPCTHGYCTGCIRLAFTHAMRDKKPFRCCAQVPINSIAKHFTPDFVTEYTWLVLELTTPNPLYCGTKSCSKFIPPHNIHGDIGICRTCSKSTCRHCNSPEHTGICAADTESAAVRELGRKNGWKPCPGCQHMVERNGGCLHMTCIKCSTEFCYNCGRLSSICAGDCQR